MSLLGTCLLVIVLAALLIIGFLRVAHDLLSRRIFEAPSLSNEEFQISPSSKSHFSSSEVNLVQAFSVLDREDIAGDAPLRQIERGGYGAPN
jgi:hypothetical protein